MNRHTLALRPTRWERLVFRLTGKWPASYVERRLAAYDKDEIALARGSDSRACTCGLGSHGSAAAQAAGLHLPTCARMKRTDA